MGMVTGLWAAITSAIADTFAEVSGHLMGRVRSAYTAGSTTIDVAETDRWPVGGLIGDRIRFAVNGVTGYYQARSQTQLTGIEDEDGNPGIPIDVAEGDVITLIATHTNVGRVRDSFFLDTAEGADLDTIGRNYGVQRIRGLGDDDYRAVLQVVIAIEGGSIYAMEKVLDAAGLTYTIYEDLETTDHTVFIDIPATAGTDFKGKAFLVGLEAQARTAPTTVDVTYPPTVAYGVWDSADYYREGTNYAEQTVAVTEVAGTDQLLGAWIVADEGKSVTRSDGAIWEVRSYLSPTYVQVGTKLRTNGSASLGAPTTFEASEPIFREWMVGHTLVVLSGNNAGTYPITVVSEDLTQLTVPSASFLTEANAAWFIQPSFAGAAASYAIHRATIAGSTVTTPVTMPANVLVDYTTIPSAQVIEKSSIDATDQYAFYLFDETFIARSLVDIVRAAGIEVVVNTV